MKIAIAGDSAGKPLVDAIEAHLKGKAEHGVSNLSQSGFYADLSADVAKAVKAGTYDRAILCCGTGIGVSIAANKVPGIRAATCHDVFSAQMSREHNDANILTLGERVIGPGLAALILDTWLKTEFAGGRHARRVDKMMAYEQGRQS